MQDDRKAVWSIPYVSVASFFPSLKQNFIAYCSSKVSDCIFEIHQPWQSGFSRVYSNCCCSCWFEAEILMIGHSSHKMYSNNILNFQESTTILNACTKKCGNLLNAPCIFIYIWIYRQYSNHEYEQEKLYVKILYIYIYIYNKYILDIYVRQLPGRPGFNPRSSHTKDSKNGTWCLLA